MFSKNPLICNYQNFVMFLAATSNIFTFLFLKFQSCFFNCFFLFSLPIWNLLLLDFYWVYNLEKTYLVLLQIFRLTIYFFRSQEFIRVGYYVSNEYQDPELQETPPEQPMFDKLTRNILVSFNFLLLKPWSYSELFNNYFRFRINHIVIPTPQRLRSRRRN